MKEDGVLLYEEELVDPTGLPKGVKKYGIPATRYAEELGRKLVLNIVMVGFFAGVTGLLSAKAMEKAVLASVPRGTEDLNLRAFKKGFEHGENLLKAG